MTDAARRDAQIRALTDAATTAAVAHLTRQVADIADLLDVAARTATTAGPGGRGIVTGAARIAAARLRRLTPRTEQAVTRHLERAARLGAGHAGHALPARYVPAADPHVRDLLERVDARIAAKVADVVAALLERPPVTAGQARDAAARVGAIESEARAAVSDVIVRAVAAGATAAADARGVALAWEPEPEACLNCVGMAGGTPRHDGLYRPVKVLTARPMPWLLEGVPGPPGHNRCRCHLTLATHAQAADIRRAADVATAYGWSAYDSLPAQLAGLDLLLRSTRLRPAVRRDAVHHAGMGRFTARGPARKARPARAA